MKWPTIEMKWITVPPMGLQEMNTPACAIPLWFLWRMPLLLLQPYPTNTMGQPRDRNVFRPSMKHPETVILQFVSGRDLTYNLAITSWATAVTHSYRMKQI